MVRIFGQMVSDGKLDGWSMTVLGGCEESQRPYLGDRARRGEGLPIRVEANVPRSVVEHAMSTASIFWSATGLGEDEERAPWAQEHFGMTTAEAMAGGCVPVVIDRAGQREIVREGVHGFRWSTPAELTSKTLLVAGDAQLQERLSKAAVVRATEFSDGAFAERWHQIVRAHKLLDGRPSSPGSGRRRRRRLEIRVGGVPRRRRPVPEGDPGERRHRDGEQRRRHQRTR
jgi:glycosyltransferase involved in cell wall biosynthesis